MLTLIREQKGTITVLTALAITVFLAFTALVVDIGVLYVNKVQLSNMADASALAGVQDLPGNVQLAEYNAQVYAAQNGKSGDVMQISVSTNNTRISVAATRTVTLFFAKVFKLYSSNVTATATAGIQAISAANGVVPFGIVKQQFVYGQTYTLKDGAGSGYNGNYGALALGGNGADNYRDNIEYGYNVEYGYSGQLSVGQWISTEPGNMSGSTSQGVAYRIGLDPNATFQTAEKDSPRIVTVPIIDSLTVNGRGEVQIVGFAAFFLEGVGGSGNDNYVYGKFMEMVMPGDISSSSSGYGLYGAKLIW